jgi:hypothetical protein
VISGPQEGEGGPEDAADGDTGRIGSPPAAAALTAADVIVGEVLAAIGARGHRDQVAGENGSPAPTNLMGTSGTNVRSQSATSCMP